MHPSTYLVVGEFRNNTTTDMRLFLELTCEEVILTPGQSVELLARPDAELLPLSINYSEKGLQIYPNNVFDPDWHVRHNGQLIKAAYPTRL